MKSVSGKELAKLVELHGWVLLRIKGSHHIDGKTGSAVRLSIPIHSNKPMKTAYSSTFSEWLACKKVISGRTCRFEFEGSCGAQG